MSRFKDHFSAAASDYARFRPGYPPQLFEWLTSLCPQRQLALDVATGNGQAAVALAQHFEQVIASDASAAQLAQAMPAANIDYRCEPAERSSLPDASVDLLVVAQALHWFDLPAFCAEAQRLLKPNGVIAVWCYGQLQGDTAINAILARYYHDIVGPFWPPERLAGAGLCQPGLAVCATGRATRVCAERGMGTAATAGLSWHLVGRAPVSTAARP